MQTALLLATIYLIFFTQYSSVSVLAPFFPTSEAAKALGETTVGLIFAAYPLGIVLATPLPPLMMRTFGASLSIGLGLLVSGVATLGFGYLPGSLGTGSSAMLSAALVAMRAVGGMGSAFADVGTFTVITTVGFGSRLGAVISMVEVVIGLAGAGGTLAGGMLYELGASTPFGAFRFPFLVMAACSVALAPLVCVALPCGKLRDGEGGTSDCGATEASTAGAAAGDGAPAGEAAGGGGLTSVTIPDSVVSIGDGDLGDSAAGGGVAPPASLWTYRRVLTLTSTLAGSGDCD
jgi:MFS family permease